MMKIPGEIKLIIEKLTKQGFEAFVVGGCVRDLLLGKKPNDWDIATNARPEQVEKIFPKTFFANKFGTVTVITQSKQPELQGIEITTFRIEAKYSDKRHPDKVRWAKTIEEDLSRRDFTINAIAIKAKSEKRPSPTAEAVSGLGPRPTAVSGLGKAKSEKLAFKDYDVIDPFSGKEDLKKKLIRAVRRAEERFQEDALRLLRAVRFAATLGFKIEKNTLLALRNNAKLLDHISKERIRDEFLKIIMSENAAQGIELLRETGLLQFVVPEILEGYKVGQNKHHIYDVYEHNLRSLDFAAKQGFNQNVRIAALLHDVGKPRTKEGEGPDSTFYNHEIVGAKMTIQILKRLKFSKKDLEKIVKLVRYHLFYYNVGEVQESSVRRLVSRLGAENLKELIQLRMADRIGSGCPKALPYKLRHFQYLAEKISQDPIDATTLKVGGQEVMDLLQLVPGPKVGQILTILLGEALDDSKKNDKKYLQKRIKELGKFSNREIALLAQKGKKKRDEIITKRDEMTKQKYWVS
jgi:tRNA nucleotidyltransferase (CCA-adding enzyme)